MVPFRRFIRVLDAFANAPAQGVAAGAAKQTSAASPPRELISVELFEKHPSLNDRSTEIPVAQVGSELVTPVGKRRLLINRLAGQGTRAKVYQVTDAASQQTYALKVIHERTPINLMAIAMETAKVDALTAYQIPCSRIIETGVTYVLKEWVDGIGGDQWLQRWLENKADPDDPVFLALMKFFRGASVKGVRLDDLRPSNLILRNGTEWMPIDVGRITAGVTPAFAMKCYRERFIRRWLWVSRSPFWYLVYWTWCLVRRPDGRS